MIFLKIMSLKFWFNEKVETKGYFLYKLQTLTIFILAEKQDSTL